MLDQLIHNGIVIPDVPLPKQLELVVRGERRLLSTRQKEMALAWARKQGTPYVKDPVFVRNFLQDLSAALEVTPPLTLDEVDFSHAIAIVQAERAAKEQLTQEERRALAAERKARREELAEQYGFAIVNGERVELANYVAEPSSIFMGRGAHPQRGRWKKGPQESDVTLNLSPDAPRPPGEWAEIVWQPESLWVARWRDKLSGKLKYVWLSDSASIKQEREAAKFDQAVELHENLEQVRAHINQGLTDPDPKRRMVATACYLIDALCLRVGDEKDPDEADTVGATTLRPEHITLNPDGSAEFNFLGKDSVRWNKTVTLPTVVWENLATLVEEARPPSLGNNQKRHPTRSKPQVFPSIGSSDVNAYLSEVLPGLTAKVFRTHHATQVVHTNLEGAQVEASDPDYKKWAAVSQANIEAAVLCNHYKKAPANWKERRRRAVERQQKLQERVDLRRSQLQEAREALSALKREAKEKKQAAPAAAQRERLQARYGKKIENAKKKVQTAQERLQRARESLEKAKVQDSITAQKRTWNLGTSLKSYIDPRVVYRWGERVDYDVLSCYYPKALRRKFNWVKNQVR
ncbi:MAG: DNA topoisomerase I [Anaerolineae bacterium]|nr:DNA topoisomerase I [Anaerolineae bacterium]